MLITNDITKYSDRQLTNFEQKNRLSSMPVFFVSVTHIVFDGKT